MVGWATMGKISIEKKVMTTPRAFHVICRVCPWLFVATGQAPAANFWPNSTFEAGTELNTATGTPASWNRGGSNGAICEVTSLTSVSATHALFLNDQDGAGYGEWYADQALGGLASPGDVLELRWSEKFDVVGGEMRLSLVWLWANGSAIGDSHSVVNGQSAGWSGDLAASPWVARQKVVVVPADAATLRLALVSGGSLGTTGVMAVDNLTSEVRPAPVVLAGNFWPNPGFEAGSALDEVTGLPTGWNRGGNEATICEVSTAKSQRPSHSLALNDTSATGYGEWYGDAVLPSAVQSGDALSVQWWEMYALTAGAESRLTALFFNAAGGVLSERHFVVTGQSAGWAGSAAASPFVKRNGSLLVPAGAVKLRFALVSGGSQEGKGVMLIDDLSVAAPARSEILAGNIWPNSTFEAGATLDLPTGTPTPWNRGGNEPAICVMTSASSISPTHALAVNDSSATGYGEWYADLTLPGTVTAGSVLDLQYFQKYAITGPGAEFRVTALFLGQAGVVQEQHFVVTGQSAGWTGPLAASPWSKRRELLTVPAGALTLRLALVSAGPVEGLGVMALEDVSVARRIVPNTVLAGGFLLNPRFEEGVQLDNPPIASPTGGWQRGGSDSGICLIASDAFLSSSHALCIKDTKADAYGEWYQFMPLAGTAVPGDLIEVAWHALYDLSGPMRFSVLFFDADRPVGPEFHYQVNGQSAGWTGDAATSPFLQGGKVLTVPEGATRLFFTLASGGGADSQGTMWLDDVSVRKSSAGPDQDGDSQGDTTELLAGTNPFDAASLFRVISLSRNGPGFDLTWTSLANANYIVDSSKQLIGGTWEPMESTRTSATEAVSSVNLPGPPAGSLFYRVRKE